MILSAIVSTKISEAAFTAFKAGDIDYRNENSASKWTKEYNFKAVEDGKIIKRAERFEGSLPVQYFAPNQRREKFKDYRTRKALALMFDFEWTKKTIYSGQYERPSSFFLGTDDLMATGLPEGQELAFLEPYKDQLPAEVFTEEPVQPVTDGSGRVRKQTRAAKKLLTEAGWQLKDGVLVDAHNTPFEIEFLGSSPAAEKIISPFIKNLERLGIQATFRQVDSAQYVRRVQSYDYDIITGQTYNSQSPGNEQREFWGSEAANRTGGRNSIGLQDPIVDAIIDKIIFAENREELAAASRALDRVLLQTHQVIMQVVNPDEWFAYWNKFSHAERLPKLTPAFTNTWWYDSDKAAKLEK